MIIAVNNSVDRSPEPAYSRVIIEKFIDEEKEEETKAAPVEIVEPVKQATVNDGYVQTITKNRGVYYYNGLCETYYSSNVAPHYRLDEWWCDSNGFWRTNEGYFVVAYTMTMPIGTVIDVSMGKAMICDHCPTDGAVDVYVNW